MKFKQYLNESEEIINSTEKFNDILHKKCKPYLQLIKPFKEPLKRGMRLGVGYKYGIKDVRQDRESIGTRGSVFKLLNTGLQKNGHNRRDKSFMATGGRVDDTFGSSFYVFPIGNFSYTGLRARDMNRDDEMTGGVRINSTPFNFETNQWDSDLTIGRKLIEYDVPFGSFFTTDRDIKKAVTNGYEIGINCKQYLFAKDYGHTKGNNKLQIIEHI